MGLKYKVIIPHSHQIPQDPRNSPYVTFSPILPSPLPAPHPPLPGNLSFIIRPKICHHLITFFVFLFYIPQMGKISQYLFFFLKFILFNLIFYRSWCFCNRCITVHSHQQCTGLVFSLHYHQYLCFRKI